MNTVVKEMNFNLINGGRILKKHYQWRKLAASFANWSIYPVTAQYRKPDKSSPYIHDTFFYDILHSTELTSRKSSK